jgi:hypothetical protein
MTERSPEDPIEESPSVEKTEWGAERALKAGMAT